MIEVDRDLELDNVRAKLIPCLRFGDIPDKYQ
jgi:hypothetical protein